MEWRFSDGTVVHLGGKVEGNGALAKQLLGEQEVERELHRPITVNVRPQPTSGVDLDVNNPRHVNNWACRGARRVGVELVSAPVLPPDPNPPAPPVREADGRQRTY